METRDQESRTAEAEFRLMTLRAGLWPSLLVCLCLGGYIAWSWDRPHRDQLVVVAIVALVFTVALAVMPLERWIRGRAREPFFLAWSTSLIGLIAAAAAIDGGAASPLTALLFLPLTYSALSYPLGSMLAVGVLDVLTYIGLAITAGGVEPAHAFIFTGALVNAAWICAWQSLNHGAQRRELARVSRSDSLTGALNRRGFEERFELEIARSRRDGGPLALVVLDLDGFKTVNDRLGHREGDALLVAVGTALQMSVRAEDAVGRFGGDEFLVLATVRDPAGAHALALHMLAAVRAVTASVRP